MNTWQQYKVGFNNGIDHGNLWLGNDRIHVMSSQSNVTLRVEINGDQHQNSPYPNLYLYGKYNFSVNTMLIKSEFHFAKYNLVRRLKIVKNEVT